MGADLKTELTVPDLWFDLYARALPGSAFVGVARCALLGNCTVPSATEMLALLAVGYFAALLSQPLASRLCGWIERLAERLAGNRDRLFVRRTQELLGSESRRSMIISKMHGEVTFFVQLAVLSVAYYCLERWSTAPVSHLGYALWICSGAFLVCALEVAHRRYQRAADYSKLLDHAAGGVGSPDVAPGKTSKVGQ